MKHYKFKRCISLLLSVMVFVVMTMVSATEVDAASSKTFYVPKTEKTTYVYTSTYEDGTTNTDKESWTTSYYYGKNGLENKYTSESGTSKISRNSKGYVTGVKSYDKNGKLQSTTTYTRKSNGDATKMKSYDYSSGKKKLSFTSTYTYWRKGVIKKSTRKDADGSTTVYNYNKKGNITSYSADGGKYKTTYKHTFKNGRLAKEVATNSGSNNDGSVATTTFTYKVKNGKVIKEVATCTTKYKDGTTDKRVTTSTYTYNSKGKITKTVSETKADYAYGGSYTSKMTTTTTYKKVSVNKKYWKLFN